ncbi:MAG: FGGY family carbohydrate kinase [Candidatus Hodarchaeales archaeon]|jgi:sugar (pentulose or hexulose) kinase
MKDLDKSGYSIGIDVGSSGIRLLLVNTKGDKITTQIMTYRDLLEQGTIIWDNENRINVNTLVETIENQLILLSRTFPEVRILSLSFSSIGPSLVLLSKEAKPLTHAFTYAYQSAQEYIEFLPTDFQERTGSLYSAALPYVQLLKIKEEGLVNSSYKITTINDYLVWNMTDLQLEEIFSTVPNASYTGLYSLKQRDWDKESIQETGLKPSDLPKLIPLGKPFPMKNKFKQVSNIFRDTFVVSGTIDGIDAFWATGVENEDIIVGSASTTGALRRLRKTPKIKYHSRQVQCCQMTEGSWVELIPFNNVGTSFKWLANNFTSLFRNYVDKSNQLNIEKLELESSNKLKEVSINLESYLLKLPVFFPYIEGEPRGPNGRGKIKGGFNFTKGYFSDCIDLYISLIIGIVNMYYHNLEMLDPPDDYKEIRLTGLIARKSRLFQRLLSSLLNKNVVIMRTEQSVAWATAMRALTYIKVLDKMPKVPTLEPILPESEMQKCLVSLYKKYIEVYNFPNNYNICYSEKEMNE